MQVPAPTNDTVAPERVHTPALADASVKTTARPELAVGGDRVGRPADDGGAGRASR